MAKKMKISVLGTAVAAVAELQEDDAPHIAPAFWEALAKPIEEKVIHAMYAGREVFMALSPGSRNFDARSLPVENATAYPSAGDIAWGFFPAHSEREQPEDLWDLAFVYGREATFDSSQGLRPISVFACITEGLDAFAEQCGRIRSHDGPKTFRLERLV
jgi:hypothetical protein